MIDYSPYWRPEKFALATIVIESIVWEDAPPSLLQQLENTHLMNQLIIRAVMWLIKSTEEYEIKHGPTKLESKVKKYNDFLDLFEPRLNKPL